MSTEKLQQYRRSHSLRLKFEDPTIEKGFIEKRSQTARGHDLSFLILGLMAWGFAFLEYWAIGANSSVPMVLFAVLGVLSPVNLFVNARSFGHQTLFWRFMGMAVLMAAVVFLAINVQGYSSYYVMEILILLAWVQATNGLRMWQSLSLAAMISVGTLILVYLDKGYGVLFIIVLVLLGLMLALGYAVAFTLERQRRCDFLVSHTLNELHKRSESWAYSLIDLDIAASGISDIKAVMNRILDFLEKIVLFDAYVITSLAGQGPKPAPFAISGELFEKEEHTLWGSDLLTRLGQTRQAHISDVHEEEKGWFGRMRPVFLHYRMDIPVMQDSELLGVISVRRRQYRFDEFDAIAAVSLVSQAMMIFKNTQKEELAEKCRQQVRTDTATEEQLLERATAPTSQPLRDKIQSDANSDLDVTDQSQFSSDDQDSQVSNTELARQEQSKVDKGKSTLTLLSRDNADKISEQRYRSAALEGESLSLLLIEIDDLSAIREKQDDKVAYKVYTSIVRYLFSVCTRDKDILGRYGKNGISLLVPLIDLHAAEKMGEKIRSQIEASEVQTTTGPLKITVSVGIAALTDSESDYATMLKRADMALFVAKKNGRNCVKVRL